ncbi:MAG: hypothetical protein ACMXYG_06520 [Candidatus Woesearchaeota archaeon]
MDFKKIVTELTETINKMKKKEVSLSNKIDFSDHKSAQAKYLTETYKKCLQQLQALINNPEVPSRVNELLRILDYNDLDKNLAVLKELEKHDVKISKDRIVISSSKLPDTIREEVNADIKELKKCFNAECYRSCVILCGRIMEVCLHAKYFKVTGFDILDKNPGIGLGKLIAKMEEKGIKLDPGLTSQIHLINNVRIFSVHKKQRTFIPSKQQTEAIILFTADVIEKMF